MKRSLLYASPFPPQQSGISHYSDLLVRGLSELFNITLLVHDCDLDPRRYRGMEIIRYHEPISWDAYDFKLYNIGNNPWYHAYIYEAALRYPGTIILHDTVLYYLFTGYYQTRESFFQQVYEQEGPLGVAFFKDMVKGGRDVLQFQKPDLLPLNRELINSGNDFLVHSDYALRSVMDRAKGPVRVGKINMPIGRPANADGRRRRLLRRFGLPPDALVLGSFGFIAPTKLNHVICETVDRLNAEGKRRVFYLMVGEGKYVDRYLGPNVQKTGFVSDREYDECLADVDIVVNLRYPSMGETSLALLRAMSFGRPCIVCDDGWFSELPKNVVVKLDPRPEAVLAEMLYDALLLCFEQPSAFEAMGMGARQWIEREFSVAKIGEQIAAFLAEPAQQERPVVAVAGV